MHAHQDSTSGSPQDGSAPEEALARLARVVHHAAHLLPAQGPITAFIHHNTLHAFEDLHFEEAVLRGGEIFGCQPYMSEDRYRDGLIRGRIRYSELRDVLEEDLGRRADDPVPCFGSVLDLRLTMLQFPLLIGSSEDLRWHVAEANSLRRVRREVSSALRARMIAETRRWVMRDLRRGTDPFANSVPKPESTDPTLRSLDELLDRYGESTIESWSDDDWEAFTLQSLWRLCEAGVRAVPPPEISGPRSTRHRDLLLEVTGEDADLLVNPLLTRFTAAYLDQGLSHWRLPRRDEGYLESFTAIYGMRGGPPDRWMRDLPSELTRYESEGISALESVKDSLAILGVPEEEWDSFLSSTFLALRGWGGMVQQIEVRGDRAVNPAKPGSLVGFLAVRLLLDRFALSYLARKSLGFSGSLGELRAELLRRTEAKPLSADEQRAFLVFQLAQLFGLSPDMLHRLTPRDWETIVREIEGFSGTERRRIFHRAYERRFYTQTLDAVALHAQNPNPTPALPRFQVVFCIDEREESMRRHLEEVAPDVETFGTAGFFSVPMYYKGADDAHFMPLCPAVMLPQHWVVERPAEELEGDYRRRVRTRRVLGLVQHQVHAGSRSLTAGAVLAASFGVLASIPLVARTLFPRLTAQFRKGLGRFVQTPRRTRLQLERETPEAGPDGNQIGFRLDEMVAIAEKVLRELGLARGERFSRMVVLAGHGSTSLNNPHAAAYDCGACGGAKGGPNARALAWILNEPRVRVELEARGIAIPLSTRFVGALHNTSCDTMIYFDLDLVPESHRADIDTIVEILDGACQRNAHERARRFMSAPLTMSFPAAQQHAEGRAEDLAQVRPELGHATNAICLVGRRAFSRGLFLDRRSFLTSYDPTDDDEEGTILARILGAVFPVCSGINLEYYFSYVDNPGFGSGTKLPHNIASLLGVMDGAASDLRTGLPWQMIEIHEPIRLLFIIETSPEIMLKLMDRNPVVSRLCRNEWVRLAIIQPDTKTISLFEGDEFQPYEPQASTLPHAKSSVDWYRGWRDHLEFAVIGS
ncbi:MAG: DUF2309 domain-containing protein [Isosphaeraceae bacterium]